MANVVCYTCKKCFLKRVAAFPLKSDENRKGEIKFKETYEGAKLNWNGEPDDRANEPTLIFEFGKTLRLEKRYFLFQIELEYTFGNAQSDESRDDLSGKRGLLLYYLLLFATFITRIYPEKSCALALPWIYNQVEGVQTAKVISNSKELMWGLNLNCIVNQMTASTNQLDLRVVLGKTSFPRVFPFFIYSRGDRG